MPTPRKPVTEPATPERALEDYRRKRDFSKTSEPGGSAAPAARPSARHGALRFVVQKHAASHLHFDFRLELDGVMKSWAIPKGPSLDPAVKRLAVPVEDHPIEYNSFEGTIPAGEYGGGTVMLWDRGTYGPSESASDDAAVNEEAILRREYESGALDITLHGERLRGRWALVRTRWRGGAGKPRWLLIKARDEYADPDTDITATATTSVATGRGLEEIGTAGKREAGSGKRNRPGGEISNPGAVPSRLATRHSRLLSQLDTIQHSGGSGTLRVTSRKTLELSSLDKVFFPEAGYTKGDLFRYYVRVAHVILPLLAGRPLVLKRSPDGVAGETFFQQNPPEGVPSAVRVESVVSEGGGAQERIVGGDISTLLYLLQLGCISMDPWLSRVGSLDWADHAILDLDPGPRAPFERVVEVAAKVREELDALGLTGALKTSGSRGLHIALPLPPRTSYDISVRAARLIATRVARSHPRAATVERSIRDRPPDAVYVDYLQNARGKSVASAYCVRARPGATISMPIGWDELAPGLDPRAFTLETAPGRLATHGDIWGAAMRRRNYSRALRALVTD